ncbi:MAG: DsbC family protein [Gammaproteobacteria bacterium]|nr:MAG: DsbC family protein [Gammaproteobacteria bacterium]
MKRILAVLAVLLTILGTAAPALAASDLQALKRKIAERLPGASVDYVAPSPVKGVYQVGVDGGDIVYVSADGRFLLTGKLIDLVTKEDITERVLAAQRVKTLSGVPEDSMIIFEPEGPVKHTLTTFTDIDCPYCRKLHKQMALLNSMGIRVRYMWFPVAGVDSLSYQKAVSVWCADDQKAEMTRAKTGAMPEIRDCDNPVREQMVLAQRLGLTGTPYTITDTGRAIAGYVPPQKLFASLEADKLKASR